MERLGPKLYSWASLLEDTTRGQAEATASMPFVPPHLALMPDAHLGKGATVGSGDPDRRGDHPGGGRGGHRVRDEGGANPVRRRGPRPATLPVLHAGSAAGPAVGGPL